METIVFNYTDSKLTLSEVTIMLSYAYITTECAACAGSTARDMFAEEYFKESSLLSKIRFLELMCDEATDYPEMFDTIRNSIEHYRYISRIKYRSSKQIIALKLLEKALTLSFEHVMQPCIDSIRNSNIREFIPLADGKTFGFYHIDTNDPEKPTAGEELTAGKLLQRIGLDQTNSELFFLSSHFFDAAFATKYKIVKDNTRELQPSEIYLQHCFTIPLLQNLKAAELKRVRDQLSVGGEQFKNALNSWIMQCYAANNISAQPFFTESVLPASIEFQQLVLRNETLKFCKKVYFNVPPSEIYIGRVPVGLLWDFYKYVDIIKDETYCILQQVLQNPDLAMQRWPVMILKDNAYLSTLRKKPVPGAETAKPLTTRKFISID